MAVLSEARRDAAWAEFMQECSQLRLVHGAMTADDIRAAAVALDEALNTNAATINGWLPQPFRGAAPIAMKALLLSYVVRYRYVDGA